MSVEVRPEPAPSWATDLATDKQRTFIGRLVEGRLLSDEQKQWVLNELNGQLTKGRAAKIIDRLLKLPEHDRTTGLAPQAVPDMTNAVPAGRYAVTDPDDGVLKFYHVDKPTDGKWAGYTFVSVRASDDLHAIRNGYRHRILNEIAKDPQSAMLRFGVELGHCGHCGRTLTNEESRALGIGPVCRQKMGW
jgi:hypothetical protein